jgi:hypothetical protein
MRHFRPATILKIGDTFNRSALRTLPMQFGSYYRRITQNPYKKMGLDVVLVSPLRIQTPYNLQEGDYVNLEGEPLRVYNGIAFDAYRNERFYCVSDRPLFTNGYYDNAVFEWVPRSNFVFFAIDCSLF